MGSLTELGLVLDSPIVVIRPIAVQLATPPGRVAITVPDIGARSLKARRVPAAESVPASGSTRGDLCGILGRMTRGA